MTISAADLEKALNKENMGATVKRDGAAEAGITAVPDHVGRSQFHARGICCASEIPAISAIVEPMPGVKSVTINTTTKTVYVDHELAVVSAQTICDALNEQQFGAEVRFDAATSATSARSTFVQSTLTWNGEGDGVDPDTEVLTNFLRGFDATQMESFFVDVPARRINVAHNPFSLTAQTVAQILEQETGLVATVEVDGADPEHWKFPTIVDQIDGMEEDETPTYPKPTVILSGIFWIVSMLHYIGGNWYVPIVCVAFLPSFCSCFIAGLSRKVLYSFLSFRVTGTISSMSACFLLPLVCPRLLSKRSGHCSAGSSTPIVSCSLHLLEQ